MLLCEESSAVLDMIKPKVKLVEESCQGKRNLFNCLMCSFISPKISDPV